MMNSKVKITAVVVFLVVLIAGSVFILNSRSSDKASESANNTPKASNSINGSVKPQASPSSSKENNSVTKEEPEKPAPQPQKSEDRNKIEEPKQDNTTEPENKPTIPVDRPKDQDPAAPTNAPSKEKDVEPQTSSNLTEPAGPEKEKGAFSDDSPSKDVTVPPQAETECPASKNASVPANPNNDIPKREKTMLKKIKHPDYGCLSKDDLDNKAQSEPSFVIIRVLSGEDTNESLCQLTPDGEYSWIEQCAISEDEPVSVPSYNAETKTVAFSFGGSLSAPRILSLEKEKPLYVDDFEMQKLNPRFPNFSPNGKYFAFYKEEEKSILIAKLNGLQLEDEPKNLKLKLEGFAAPYFSNDGKSIIYIEKTQNFYRVGKYDILECSKTNILNGLVMDTNFNHVLSSDQTQIVSTVLLNGKKKLEFYFTDLMEAKIESKSIRTLDVNPTYVYRLVSFRQNMIRYSVSDNAGGFEIYEFDSTDSKSPVTKIEKVPKVIKPSGGSSSQIDSVYGSFTEEELKDYANNDPVFTFNQKSAINFQKHFGLFALLADGSIKKLETEGITGSYIRKITYSPKTRMLAVCFSSDEQNSIAVYGFDENCNVSFEKRVVINDNVEDFSPDGKYILSSRKEKDHNGLVIVITNNIFNTNQSIELFDGTTNDEEIVQRISYEHFERKAAVFSKTGRSILLVVKAVDTEAYQLIEYDLTTATSKVIIEDLSISRDDNVIFSFDVSKIAIMKHIENVLELHVIDLQAPQMERQKVGEMIYDTRLIYTFISFKNNVIQFVARYDCGSFSVFSLDCSKNENRIEKESFDRGGKLLLPPKKDNMVNKKPVFNSEASSGSSNIYGSFTNDQLQKYYEEGPFFFFVLSKLENEHEQTETLTLYALKADKSFKEIDTFTGTNFSSYLPFFNPVTKMLAIKMSYDGKHRSFLYTLDENLEISSKTEQESGLLSLGLCPNGKFSIYQLANKGSVSNLRISSIDTTEDGHLINLSKVASSFSPRAIINFAQFTDDGQSIIFIVPDKDVLRLSKYDVMRRKTTNLVNNLPKTFFNFFFSDDQSKIVCLSASRADKILKFHVLDWNAIEEGFKEVHHFRYNYEPNFQIISYQGSVISFVENLESGGFAVHSIDCTKAIDSDL